VPEVDVNERETMHSLLPPGVAVAEAQLADWTAPIRPEEAALIPNAVEKRRREFAAGRSCARRALTALGWSHELSILSGTRGEPLWPAGVVGSITHCKGYCAAAVALADRLQSIGIDAEPNVPLDERVRRGVCTPAEARRRSLRRDVDEATILFSAKESVFKAWYPLTGHQLDFQDVEIGLDWTSATFSVRFLRPEPDVELHGSFRVTAALVLTAVSAPRHATSVTPVTQTPDKRRST
jgi:4'-phosphopantetheinyl transferase EntD